MRWCLIHTCYDGSGKTWTRLGAMHGCWRIELMDNIMVSLSSLVFQWKLHCFISDVRLVEVIIYLQLKQGHEVCKDNRYMITRRYIHGDLPPILVSSFILKFVYQEGGFMVPSTWELRNLYYRMLYNNGPLVDLCSSVWSSFTPAQVTEAE